MDVLVESVKSKPFKVAVAVDDANDETAFYYGSSDQTFHLVTYGYTRH